MRRTLVPVLRFAANKQIRHSNAVLAVTYFFVMVCAKQWQQKNKRLEPVFVVCLIKESNMHCIGHSGLDTGGGF
jgi:hypothetical protein